MSPGIGYTIAVAAGIAGGVLLLGLLLYRTIRRGASRAATIAAFLFGIGALCVGGITLMVADRLDGAFWQPMLFEAYGMLLDLLVIGVLLVGLLEWRLARMEIRGYSDAIDDFRGWRSPLAANRIRGTILRLNRRNMSQIDLSRCYLRNMNLASARLAGALMVQADLQNAYLARSDLRNADLQAANLRHAFLWHADLRKAVLWSAHLEEASLEGADLSGAILTGADLTSANLEGATLLSATGLTVEQLAGVKTLYKAQLDPELAGAVRSRQPDLLAPSGRRSGTGSQPKS